MFQFLNANPTFISDLHIYSHFTACSDLDVILKLHEYQLLPEEHRRTFVARIKELAASTPDAGFLREDIGLLLSINEKEETLNHVKESLIPRLYSVIQGWKWDYNSDDDPESHFEELVGSLVKFKETFEDTDVRKKIERGLEEIKEIVEELNGDYTAPSSRKLFDAGNSIDKANGFRSIFDDVDI